MNGWSTIPLAAVIPERVIVYPPLLSGAARTAIAFLLLMALLGVAVRYRHHLRRLWRGGRPRTHFRPIHA